MKQSASHSISRLYSIQYFFLRIAQELSEKTVTDTNAQTLNKQDYQNKMHHKEKQQTPRFTVLSCTQNVFYSAISIKIFFWSGKKALLYFCTGSTQDTFWSYSDGFILLYDYDKSQVSSVFLGKQKRISVQEIGLSINRQRLLLIPRMLVFYCCSSHKWITDISQFDLKLSL